MNLLPAITLELRGRLIGPRVPLLEAYGEAHEGRHPAGATIAVDPTGVTAIDGVRRYLLRLMEAISVTWAGGGIGIRAPSVDGQSPLWQSLEIAASRRQTASTIASRDSRSPGVRMREAMVRLNIELTAFADQG